MVEQILEVLAGLTETTEEVGPDLLLFKFTVVNSCVIENREQDSPRWVVVDTGLDTSEKFIIEKTQERFGRKSKPEYILLTHGHFDHTGSVKALSAFWDVPVYAARAEFPYLTGDRDYPPGNPEADEGLVARMSAHFPNRAIDLGDRLLPLPDDGTVPDMPQWRWIATPGHTEGHICLFREKDRLLIAGDAFTGTKQESLLSVLTQKDRVKGPPAYFTQDWEKAKESVVRLRDLKPSLAILSHGNPMSGHELQEHLDSLAENFDKTAVPRDQK